ncbi:MAG: VPLPA-CTERM sorting domain-containing protein [Gammaproteobacteria bacterium]
MRIQSLIGVAALCVASASADAALLGRDLNGSPGSFEAYYDTTLNVSWLANANLAITNTFGVGGISGTGRMTWDTANAWIAAMNSANYLGVNSWRLPKMVDIGGNGCTVNSFVSYNGGDCGYNVVSTGAQASEMASLYYDTLGNLAFYNTSGVPNFASPSIQNTGPFQNLGNTLYWYDLETSTSSSGFDFGEPLNAWYFGMPSGGQRPQDKTDNSLTTWAVVNGDIAVVPVPAAVWLFGSAMGVLGFARRRTV